MKSDDRRGRLCNSLPDGGGGLTTSMSLLTLGLYCDICDWWAAVNIHIHIHIMCRRRRRLLLLLRCCRSAVGMRWQSHASERIY